MHDPARIPRVLDQLRRTWEGQPDLPLATLFGILANRGAGWGTTDEELEQLLIDESFAHPSDLPRAQDGRVSDDVLVETVSPAHRVTLTAAGDVVVRSLGDRDRQPSVWQYDSVRPTGPGRMLTIADSEGMEHRLGVVTLISRIDSTATGSVTGSGTGSGQDTPAATSIDGLARDEIGNSVWLVLLAGGVRMLITQRLHLWQVDKRTVTKTTHAWNQVVRCRMGENFVYETAGGEAVTMGEVVKLLLVES
ncbi:hypothetical protein [Corynebacterium sp. Marseille-P3884]|uniref:hypothetical protein n=1 Tax=Corynebacterium sp. Marseille-P3884 TaxID=2495409 RepID=UPI001B33543A|nr:hypothetical protein [Corynebacterium sp. Marseille-P3884]